MSIIYYYIIFIGETEPNEFKVPVKEVSSSADMKKWEDSEVCFIQGFYLSFIFKDN